MGKDVNVIILGYEVPKLFNGASNLPEIIKNLVFSVNDKAKEYLQLLCKCE